MLTQGICALAAPEPGAAGSPIARRANAPRHPPAARDSLVRDRALARAGAAGNETALRWILLGMTDRLHAIAWHMSYDHDDADDLCQEALLRVSSPSVLGAYRADGPLNAYLTRVGVRTMIGLRRGLQARERWEMPGEHPVEIGACAHDGYEPALGLQPALASALAALPERARLVVLLITVGQYRYEETALALNLPVGTVKSTYHRARTALRRTLSDPCRSAPCAGAAA